MSDEASFLKDLKVKKADGALENFDPDKFLLSIKKSGASEETAKTILSHIKAELSEGISTSRIYSHARKLLAREHAPNADRYSLKRALVGFGPTGFPFEEYVKKLFEYLGYKSERGVMMSGKCARHEVDLLAIKKDKILIGEVKFHNSLGLKTDIKTALYVKARIDDLSFISHTVDGAERKIDEGWLITNTKFSETAISYSICSGLKLLGWNYPLKNNLQDLIEESGLHPVSCLSSLTVSHKKKLFDKGIVLCKSLNKDRRAMRDIGLEEDKMNLIDEEIKSLCAV